jgi:hypothetical protein
MPTMSSLSPIVEESTAIDIGGLTPARPRWRDRVLAQPASERLEDDRERRRGEELLRVALLVVVGLPVGALAGTGLLLALLMAGSIIIVAAVLLGVVFVALLATGAAG